MAAKGQFSIGKIRFGAGVPLFLIAGPCVIESESHAMSMAEQLGRIAADLHVPYIFKASYDKANRSSVSSYRGPGLKKGLKILAQIKKRTGLPILSDVHEISQVKAAAEVCDILQVPAFLSRQTDLLTAVGESGAVVNLKKGQFLSPWEMGNAAEKVAAPATKKLLSLSAARRLGTRISSWTCVRFRFSANLAIRLFSTSPTPCNYPAEKASQAAASRNSSSRLLARERLPAWMEFSSKSTTIRRRLSRTARTRCHSINFALCLKKSRASRLLRANWIRKKA
jgi:hypothetical protein